MLAVGALVGPAGPPAAVGQAASARLADRAVAAERAVVLDGNSLEPELIRAVLRGEPMRVELSPQAKGNLDSVRKGAEEYLKNKSHRVYGWNQALGPLKGEPLTPEQQLKFQVNVLRSHASGVGADVPERVTRLALLLRANTMARGHMGVRSGFVQRTLDFLNAGVTPVLPQIGPLGTGDLQPMAQAGLVLTGDEQAKDARTWFRGQTTTAARAVESAKLPAAFALEQGEALPLISGNSVLTARYAHAVARSAALLDQTEQAFALFMEAIRAEQGSLDSRTHEERKFPEQAEVADRVRTLTSGSQWMTEPGRKAFEDHPETLGGYSPRVQDAVSVRAAPQIIGTARRTVDEAWRIVADEANASTSNPLIFCKDSCEFVMGGNWDAARIGHAVDTLNAQMTDVALLLHALGERLMSKEWSYGLTPSLVGVWGKNDKAGLNSGMVQVQTVSAAVVPEMQVHAAPAGVLSRPVKFGQEDHNTMAVASVRHLHENLDGFEKILGVTWLMTAQGVDIVGNIGPEEGGDAFMKGLPMAKGTEAVQQRIRQVVPMLKEDRWMAPELDTMITWVHTETDPATGTGGASGRRSTG
ncbi:aromatic amino acid ammonia-lyase [Embleya sp. NPDC005971]|uniref:HAL/PAL/TAL family ammonia-lyase n=1 Tax=Embleya sp. NPDC005971 TaxID=3156724 RepID=UPI0033E73609